MYDNGMGEEDGGGGGGGAGCGGEIDSATAFGLKASLDYT